MCNCGMIIALLFYNFNFILCEKQSPKLKNRRPKDFLCYAFQLCLKLRGFNNMFDKFTKFNKPPPVLSDLGELSLFPSLPPSLCFIPCSFFYLRFLILFPSITTSLLLLLSLPPSPLCTLPYIYHRRMQFHRHHFSLY